MKTIINAIENLVSDPILELGDYYNSRNRANSEGKALEEYIKDLFAGTLRENDDNKRLDEFDKVFSYLGNDNAPPDAMLKNGDAIEVKKIESYNGDIQLNSSHTKQKLYSTDSMLIDKCKNAENGAWVEKDLIYIVGNVKNKILKSLFMIYGVDYGCEEKKYIDVVNKIKDNLNSIDDLEFSETKELGRLNNVDPLGITSLRIRGMWVLVNPWKTFSGIAKLDTHKKFEFCAIINEKKYKTFDINDRKRLEKLGGEIKQFSISDVSIKNPDNPSELVDAKMFRFFID